MLAHPFTDVDLGLFTDASNSQIGDCLQQLVDKEWQPLAFFSKKLNSRQCLWPAYYRELLAVYEAVQHFRHILEVQHCTIYTDHKPLLYAFKQRREKLPSVQLNHLSFISQFTTDVKHIRGVDNIVADAFSRIEVISLEDDYAALAESQEKDEELQELLQNGTSLILENVTLPGTDIKIICDTATGKPRPFLTLPFRRKYFEKLHNLSHPGIRVTSKLIVDRFVWPSIRKDLRRWSRSCLPCQKNKVTRHTNSTLGIYDTPSGRFKHIHIDIVGPLPICEGHRYLLTATDRFTRWIEAWPMITITSEETANNLLLGWIARFGVPASNTTDQGRQFESDLFRKLMALLGTYKNRTTSYHPCSNGMIERPHRQLKASLMCRNESWLKALPIVLLGIRTVLKEDLKASAAELLYGEPLRLPGEMIIPTQNSADSSEFVAN